MTQTPEPVPAREQLAAAGEADLAAVAPEAGPHRWRAETEFLLARWSEPARRYHTVRHLAEVLGAVDELAGAGSCSPSEAGTARLAAWYHDVVYDPRAAAGSNEHRSAAIARDRLHRLGAAGDVVEAVERLVLMTLAHDTADQGATGALAVMHDADLWVLAAPAGRFDQYCHQVRQEYAHVPPERYARARTEVLERLVAGPVYRTRHGAAEWEDRARANVARELERLAAPAGS